MIVTESYELNDIAMTKTYSDIRHYIQSDETGAAYEEAHDPTAMNRTYTETDDVIVVEFADETEEMRASLAVLGVKP